MTTFRMGSGLGFTQLKTGGVGFVRRFCSDRRLLVTYGFVLDGDGPHRPEEVAASRKSFESGLHVCCLSPVPLSIPWRCVDLDIEALFMQEPSRCFDKKAAR